MNINELIILNEKLPSEIYKAQVEAEKKREEWQLDKEDLRNAEAKHYLMTKAEHGGTQSDLKAEVDRAVYKARCKVIERESWYRKADLKADELRNKFDAVRKHMNWEIEAIKRGV